MKVFIGWSGPASHQVASALRDWLPCVIQAAKPFLSSEDIRKGGRWQDDVGKQLEDTHFGIPVLTPSNLSAPWILFEAGALSKKLDTSNVSPLLIGLKPDQVKSPLSMFQHTLPTKEDVAKLAAGINKALSEPLQQNVLERSFERHWEDLEGALARGLEAVNKEGAVPPPVKTVDEKLDEILGLLRGMDQRAARSVSPNAIAEALKQPGQPLSGIAQLIATEGARLPLESPGEALARHKRIIREIDKR